MNRVANGRSNRRTCWLGVGGVVVLALLGAVAPACLNRPVAEQQPMTERVSTQLYRSDKVNKIDLLFMIDNSASMADKQLLLAQAVPDLVARLTNPVCVDTLSREYVDSVGSPTDPCPEGTEREFDPILDIHIGIVTSSLGSFNTNACPRTDPTKDNADMSHLITRGVDGEGKPTTDVDTYDKGFLNWDPAASKPPGEVDVATLLTKFTNMIRGAGEKGCGYEASLEAWYRFLVDPAPYEDIVGGDDYRYPSGVDALVLQQRKDFLRNDSLLAIIMVTDENDCSLNHNNPQSWLGADYGIRLSRPTAMCETNSLDPACTSCWAFSENRPPECSEATLTSAEDPANLRCFEPKRRFGLDFLFPINRYVEGLTKPFFQNGEINPVFCRDASEDRLGCKEPIRQNGLIFLAGIVGVPWQDIARDPSDLKKGYRPAEQLSWTPDEFAANEMASETPEWLVPLRTTDGKAATIWNVILGETNSNHEIIPTVRPLDPLMVESRDRRDTMDLPNKMHPVTGENLVPPGNTPVNSINGAERENLTDLQYACIFKLPQPLTDCTVKPESCDCVPTSGKPVPDDPLCWDGAVFGTTQQKAKAYPGRRQLATLQGMGDQAIVASICAAEVENSTADDYGYRPAIGAIVDRLKSALAGACWDSRLDIDSKGKVQCTVLEATGKNQNGECPPCTGVRSNPTIEQQNALEADFHYKQNQMQCICVIKQVNEDDQHPDAMKRCTEQEAVSLDSEEGAWCYIDPAQDSNHNVAIVSNCPASKRRIIRFVGDDVPRAGALTYLQCRGGELGN